MHGIPVSHRTPCEKVVFVKHQIALQPEKPEQGRKMRPAPDIPQQHSRLDFPVNVLAAVGPVPNLDKNPGDVLLLQDIPMHASASCGTGTLRHGSSFLNQPPPRP